MKFSDFMMAIHACDVDLPTYTTPSNLVLARDEFLANPELVEPNFTYDAYDFTDKSTRLRKIKQELANQKHDMHPAMFQITKEYLEIAINKLCLLETMQDYRNAREIRQPTGHLRWMIEWFNKQLNDLPDEANYRYLLENPTAKSAGFTPKPETIQKFRELIESKWAKSFARVDMSREEYSPQEVCDLVNTIIQEDFGFKTDFRARIDEKKTGMNVDQISRILDIPARRAKGKFTPDVVRNIVLGHETFGHLYRAAFMQAKHPEIGIPLPDYITFEEGVTKCIEQALSDEQEICGALNYAICGAAFCDQLSFRKAFDRHCEYVRIHDASVELSETEINSAFARTTRAFRGTGDIPWTDPTVYFNGPQKVWPFIEQHIDEPEVLWKLLFESGKTDPTLDSHQELLELYAD